MPGAAVTIDALRAAGHTVRVFTNTDSPSESEIRDRLDLPAVEILTPVTAASRVLAAHPGGPHHGIPSVADLPALLASV